ncbi:MAG: hypothetical protein JNK86_01935, partial [Alphaproteobacteria bacterium]|nr:hypothetical protein [Alphaproteobacteria bacterium]
EVNVACVANSRPKTKVITKKIQAKLFGGITPITKKEADIINGANSNTDIFLRDACFSCFNSKFGIIDKAKMIGLKNSKVMI